MIRTRAAGPRDAGAGMSADRTVPGGTGESDSVRPAGAADEAGAGARITIDLAALVANRRYLAALASPAECGAVVKADAYGIGIGNAVPALHAAGCRTFFVALPAEGRRVRALAPDATIYVLNGPLGADAAALAADRLIPFLSSAAAAENWAQTAAWLGRRLPAALNVDTGMTRLGLAPSEATALAGNWPSGLELKLLASHLACADEPADPMNYVQLAQFREVRERFPGVPASLANSAGVLNGADWHFDLVRPGIALYGARAVNSRPPLATVVTLEARIVQVRTAAAGDRVGYGAAHTLARDSRIAIVSAGYADGYLRAAGGSDGAAGAPVFLAGHRARLVGRVSMDLVAVDVTDVPEEHCREGGWIELFGPNVPIDEVAAHAGTIGYELLTGLSPRAARRTLGAGEGGAG